MPGGLCPPLCCQQTSGGSRLAGWVPDVCNAKELTTAVPNMQQAPSPSLLGCTSALHRSQAWKSPGKGLCALWTVSSRAAQSHRALSLPSCRGFQAGMPLLSEPGSLCSQESHWNPSLFRGEQLNGSPEGNFQKKPTCFRNLAMQKVFPIPLAVREGTAGAGDFFDPWRLQNRPEEGGLAEPLAQGVGLGSCRLPKLWLLSLEPGVCCLPGAAVWICR